MSVRDGQRLGVSVIVRVTVKCIIYSDVSDGQRLRVSGSVGATVQCLIYTVTFETFTGLNAVLVS